MESSDEDPETRESLMQEAIRILNQEGFTLPGDVVDTLASVSRSNAAARRRGSLRGHRMSEVQSHSKKIRNVRESSGRRGQDRSSERSSSENTSTQDSNSTSSASTVKEANRNVTRQDSDEVFLPSDEQSIKGRTLEREESTESGSSASTVRENLNFVDGQSHFKNDHGYAGASATNFGKQAPRESVGSDTGYHTSIENVIQSREAKSENLKNMNKTTSYDSLKGGLKREISCDSGFTECSQLPVAESSSSEDQALTTQDFNNMSISNSDVSERFVASGAGEAHVVISSATDLTAAQMTSKGDTLTKDGKSISSTAKLENQESNSALLRVTNKITNKEVSKEDNYESVNKTSKSSRNDSVSTSASGETVTASRQAASIEQGLYKERSKLSKSQDGSSVAADMSIDQQLSRNQELNSFEQSDDGSSKMENKKLSERNMTSKSFREQNIEAADGSMTGQISSSQNIDSSLKTAENEETITSETGDVIKRRQDSVSSSFNENSSSEKKIVKQNPYNGGTSTELVQKTESSSVSTESKTNIEKSETDRGIIESKHEEDSKSMTSSFKGHCESEDIVNGLKLRRIESSDKKSESSITSSRSVSSQNSIDNRKDVTANRAVGRRISENNDTASNYSGVSGISKDEIEHQNSIGKRKDVTTNRAIGRRISEDSDAASNYSGVSGLSKDEIEPPSYEETISNLSRTGSHGSLSSIYSRQDSSASSIASSASAFNERQRQKALDKERNNSLERRKSRESGQIEYNRRPTETSRQNSFSSDSTVTSGKLYEGREIVHPIRKTDTNVYGRSLTDSVISEPLNRRATLLGDVILTERELRQAREDVRRMGRDDSYIDDKRNTRNYKIRNDNKKDFDVFGTTSFKDEVMSLVDKFFEDDDDDDITGFGSRKRRNNKSYHTQLKRSDDNPYSVREDLSKYRELGNSLIAPSTGAGYAASDSGFPIQSRRHRSRDSNLFDSDFSDVASDSGHNRFSKHSRNNTSLDHYSNITPKASSRTIPGNDYQFSHLSTTYSSRQANDLIQKAGKSIDRDRNITSSILDRSENIHCNNRINNYERAEREYLRRCETGEYRSGESGTDMSDVDSTCYSMTSLPNDIYRKSYDHDSEDVKTRSLPNISDSYGDRDLIYNSSHPENKEQWNDRRRRIDKALSWIRSELSVLRTQDKVLMSQFQRCQDSIEELKRQRPWYEVYSDDEEEDEGKNWEDWEIDDFNKKESDRNGHNVDSSRAGTESKRSRGLFSRVFKSSGE